MSFLCQWHDVMPTPVPVTSNDQRSHVTPHFDHLDVRNATGAIDDADANAVASHNRTASAICDAHGITYQKVMFHFILIIVV